MSSVKSMQLLAIKLQSNAICRQEMKRRVGKKNNPFNRQPAMTSSAKRSCYLYQLVQTASEM